MRVHRLTAEEGTLTPRGWVLSSWCPCGLLMIAKGRTAHKAQRKLRRRMRDHRGFAAAAGPGWLE